MTSALPPSYRPGSKDSSTDVIPAGTRAAQGAAPGPTGPGDGVPTTSAPMGDMPTYPMMPAGEIHPRGVLLDGDEAFARVRGFLCDAAAICACYREHVGPPSKPLKSQIRELQRALGRAEIPGVPDELARLLAQEKEEDAEEGARKVKEDRGDVDEEAW